MAKIEEKVENLIESKISDLGYNLYDVEYVKEGKDYFLRIFIDKAGGITLNDCELVSNSINEILDAADFINEQYFLEVSSTGVEKVLKKDKHLQENIGTNIQIKMFKPFLGKKQYDGILVKFNENEICIEMDSQIISIERSNISQIKTIFEWN